MQLILSSPELIVPVYLFASAAASSGTITPASLAAQYALASSTSLSFPSTTLVADDTSSYLSFSWNLNDAKVQFGADDIDFVTDPFSSSVVSDDSSNSNDTVLQVTYPAGSYSQDTGGAQWYTVWPGDANSTSSGTSGFNSVLLTYEVAFDTDFDWVLGGKLPGLRGGSVTYGCDGGDVANGTNCFSSRLMWREDGMGEVYAYIVETDALCSSPDVMCNSDSYGTSIDRGAITFTTGEWNQVAMLVRLNDPPTEANGQVLLYYNGVKAIDQTGLQYRSTSDVTIGGLFFSTFFGGDNSSWATPSTVHSYYRNIELWGSTAGSNLTASAVMDVLPNKGAWLGSIMITALVGVMGLGALW